MKTSKRILATILALIMCMSTVCEALAISVFAEEDTSMIKTFKAVISEGADKRENGDYVWTAIEPDAGHMFIYHISYAFSGETAFDAGEITMRFPKTILVDRYGNRADTYDVAVPEDNEPDLPDNVYFTYHEEGDDIVVTNRRDIPGGWAGYIEIGYITSEETFEYADYGTPGMTYEKAGSAPFEAFITVKHEGKTCSRTAEADPVYIDTGARIMNSEKEQQVQNTLVREWNTAWGEKPEDADDYYYLVWRFTSAVQATQAYDFTIDEFFTPGSHSGLTGFEPEELDIVAYNFAGSSGYTNDNTDHDSRITYNHHGYRYDYVVTRHSKEKHYTIIDEAIDTPRAFYMLNNKAFVTVTPLDRQDDPSIRQVQDTYKYERSSWTPPSGLVNAYIRGLDSHGYENFYRRSDVISSYMLEEFKEGQEAGGLDELTDLHFVSYAFGYPYPWTAEGGNLSDRDAYGKVPITVVIQNDSFSLSDGEPLTTDDYDIRSIRPYYSARYAVFNDDPEVMKYETYNVKNFTEDDTMTIYLLVPYYYGNTQKVQAAVFHMADGTFTDINSYYVESTTSAGELKLKPGANVVGYSIEAQTAYYYFDYGVDVNVTLKRTESVLAKIGTEKSTRLTDNGFIQMICHTGEEADCFFDKDDFGDDYITGMVRHGRVKKDVLGYNNNKKLQQMTVNWTVSGWEEYLDGDTYPHKLMQESGVLYDLLPMGSLLDVKSIQAYAGGQYQHKGSYTVEVTENYEGTGQTLLTVRFKNSADIYTIYYTSVHTWDMLHDFGKDLQNTVVYETGNKNIGDGMTADEMPIPGLGTEGDLRKRFINGGKIFSPNLVTAGNIGLYKRVSSADNPTYTDKATVKPESEYVYLLRFSTDVSQKATGLVLFDSLESYTIGEGENAKTSGWHGTLTGVDLSGIRNLADVSPVVYYATTSDRSILNVESLDAVDSAWVEQSIYEGTLDEVKAVAVDLRLMENGEPYIMPEKTGASIRLIMKSPVTVEDNQAKTYNDVFINTINIDSDSDVWDDPALVQQVYTTVTFHHVGDVELKKVETEDPDVLIEGAVFRLYGTSDYGTAVDITAVSQADGKVLFEDVERGEYLLEEISLPNGDHFINPHIWNVRVVDKMTTYIDEAAQAPHIVTDDIRVHGDLKLRKVGEMDHSTARASLPGTTFKLEGMSAYGNEYVFYGVTGYDGTLTFENVEMGTYTLTEVMPAEGYMLPDITTWTVICDSTGFVYVEGMNALGEHFEFINEPYHEIAFKKLDSFNPDKQLPGAVFTLKGTSDRGTVVDMTAVSDKFGSVIFDGLEAGTYVLRETVAPENYLLDEEAHIVSVDSDGNVKGLTPLVDVWGSDAILYPGYSAFLNERAHEGTIEIIKEWSDDNASDRPIPVVDLSTREPEYTKTSATILRWLWDNALSSHRNKDHDYYDAVAFKRSASPEPPEYADRIDDRSNPHKIYMWIEEGTNIWYWWSDAQFIYLPSDSSEMITYFDYLQSIDFADISSAKVTSMYYMFDWCESLTSLDLSGFDTSNVTDMEGMFRGLTGLTSIDLSCLDTSSVTDMSWMFECCYGLESVNMSGLNTSNVTNMEDMFDWCHALSDIKMDGVDTSNVQDMSYMFCSTSLTNADFVENFDTSSVVWMYYMFSDCEKLTSAKVTLPAEAYVYGMFDGCTSLTDVELISPEGTIAAERADYMFNGCKSLKTIDLSMLDVSNVMQTYYMFADCTALETINVNESWSLDSVTSSSNMFNGCVNLKGGNGTVFSDSHTDAEYARIDTASTPGYLTCRTYTDPGTGTGTETDPGTGAGTETGGEVGEAYLITGQEINAVFKAYAGITNTSSQYTGLRSFTRATSLPADSVTKTEIQTSDSPEKVYMWYSGGTVYWYSEAEKVYLNSDCSSMFRKCANMALDFSGLDTSRVTNASMMFYQCSGMKSIGFLTELDWSSLRDVEYMFYECTGLTSVDLRSMDLSSVRAIQSMFYGCSAITSVNMSGMDLSNVIYFMYVFEKCSKLESVDMSYVDLSGTQSFAWAFGQCGKLTSVNMTGLKTTGSLVYLNYMLYGCSSLADFSFLNVLDMSSVEGMKSMFYSCRGMTEFDMSGWEMPAIIEMDQMFNGCSNLKTLKLSNSDTPALTNVSQMFSGCAMLESIEWNGLNLSSVTNLSNLFAGCTSLTDEAVGIECLAKAHPVSISGMFSNCGSLTRIDLSDFDLSGCTYFGYVFRDCTNLTEVILGEQDVSEFTNFDYLFENCPNLKTVDLSGFRPSTINASSFKSMFSGDGSLETIKVNQYWIVLDLADTTNMFAGCTSLKGGNGTAFDPAYTDGRLALADLDGQSGYLTMVAVEEPESEDVGGSFERDPYIRRSNSVMYEGDDPDSAVEQWIDNGDGTWTYRFKVFNEDTTYYAWEEKLPGYESDVTEESPVITEFKVGQIGHVSVKNTRVPAETAAIIVSKTVSGEVKTADLNKAFTFTVTVPGLPDGIYGQMTFVNGSTVFTLKHNESIYADHIPAGLTYTITEQPSDGYTTTPAAGYTGTLAASDIINAAFTNEKQIVAVGSLTVSKTMKDGMPGQAFAFRITLTGADIPAQLLCDDILFVNGIANIKVKAGESETITDIPAGLGYKVEEIVPGGFNLYEKTGDTGTIRNGETAAAVFVNERAPKSITPNTAKITVICKIEGVESTDKFKYNLFLEDLEPGKTYVMSDGTEFTANELGIAVVEFELGHNESVTIDKLPAGTHYAVTQGESEKYTARYEIAANTIAGLAGFEENANSEPNKRIGTKRNMLEAKDDIHCTFINKPEVDRFGFGKQDEEGYALPGAKLQIVGANGTVVCEWISSDEGMIMLELAPGLYTMHEAAAPDGYLPSADIGFEVTEDGNLLILNTKTGEYEDAGYAFIAMTDAYRITMDYSILPDVVVIDYGLPVSISVLVNDELGKGGIVYGVSGIEPEKVIGTDRYAPTRTPDADFEGAAYTAKFGSAVVSEDGKNIVYTVNSMSVNETDSFWYCAIGIDKNGSPIYYYEKVTVVPATIIYYEDNDLFMEFSDGWKVDGETITAKQSEDRPGAAADKTIDADNVYGYDPAYTNCKTYSLGSAHKAIVSKDKSATVKFTFTGTGFDVISMTDQTTGAFLVDVTSKTDPSVSHCWAVDNYYGYSSVIQDAGWIKYDWTYSTDECWHVSRVRTILTNDEYNALRDDEKHQSAPQTPNVGTTFTTYEKNYEWVKADTNQPLYQIPVLKAKSLDYDTYDVTITAYYNELFDHGQENYTLYLDAIRIYNPAKNDAASKSAYVQDNEANPTFYEIRDLLIAADDFDSGTDASDGIVFIDAFGATSSMENFMQFGPNNEVYLQPDQSIAFIIDGSWGKVHLSAKAVTGVAMMSVNGTPYVLETSTDLYYDVTSLIGTDKRQVVITNTGNTILSLTNVKITMPPVLKSAVRLYATSALVKSVSEVQTAAYIAQHTSSSFVPAAFAVMMSKDTVRRGDLMLFTFTTSFDVMNVTVNGVKAKLISSDNKFGKKVWTFSAKALISGTYNAKIVAVNESGLATEEIVRQAEVLGTGAMSGLKGARRGVTGRFTAVQLTENAF